MTPKTKNEKRVTRLSALLPDVSAAQIKYVRSHLFDKNGYLCNGEVYCSCCGHVFNAQDTGKTKCPCCSNELNVTKSRKSNVSDYHYFTVLTTFKGWQVVRNYKVHRYGRKKPPFGGSFVNYHFHEVGQCWYNAQGEQVVMGVGRTMGSWYNDAWSYAQLSVKRNIDIYMFSDVVYPRMSLLPELIRNGYDKSIDACQPTMIRALLRDNKAETILKAGYTELFMRIANGHLNMDKAGRWDAFKICLRNHYTLEGYMHEGGNHGSKWNDYFDYIDNLVELGKDVHNAHYVCPQDFKQTKNKVMEQVINIRRQRRLEEQRKKAQAEEENYKKAKGKYLGLNIIGKGICIMPLQCVDDFYHEGEAMHHCVFSNRYYAKENSLILTAREYVGGKRLETIEIDLKTFKIIQSRGVNNGYTKKHKTIIKLMNDHMDEVRRLSRSRKRTKASERITAVA